MAANAMIHKPVRQFTAASFGPNLAKARETATGYKRKSFASKTELLARASANIRLPVIKLQPCLLEMEEVLAEEPVGQSFHSN